MEKALIACDMSPALSVWAYVQSIPEPGLVILSLGKREIDASFDCEFPIPKMHYKRCKTKFTLEAGTQAPLSWKMVHIMDQHSFMTINDLGENDQDFVQVGDVLSFAYMHGSIMLSK
jgi:D-serine dehydratase